VQGEAVQDVLDEGAAAHVLLNGTRHATRLEILLSTIIEVLARGSHDTDELVEAVQPAWPAAGIARVMWSRPSGSRSPETSASFTGSMASVATSGTWTTPVERKPRRHAIGWPAFGAARSPTCRHGRNATSARALKQRRQRWVGRLVAALDGGIRAAQQAYVGVIGLGSETTL
jgi:hypothetical protein